MQQDSVLGVTETHQVSVRSVRTRLRWPGLQSRRKSARLSMMNRITHKLVHIDIDV